MKNVFIITADKSLKSSLDNNKDRFDYNLFFVESGYKCSMLINESPPDFVIVDSSLGQDFTEKLIASLTEDPRLPFVRIILMSDENKFSDKCERKIFARLDPGFILDDIVKLIEN